MNKRVFWNLFIFNFQKDTWAHAIIGMKLFGNAREKKEFGGSMLLLFDYFVFRNNNPTYSKRLVELKRLPEEYYTPALKKLKDQGILIIEDSAGCKI